MDPVLPAGQQLTILAWMLFGGTCKETLWQVTEVKSDTSDNCHVGGRVTGHLQGLPPCWKTADCAQTLHVVKQSRKAAVARAERKRQHLPSLLQLLFSLQLAADHMLWALHVVQVSVWQAGMFALPHPNPPCRKTGCTALRKALPAPPRHAKINKTSGANLTVDSKIKIWYTFSLCPQIEEERVGKAFHLTLCTAFDYLFFRIAFQKWEDVIFSFIKTP